MILISTRRSKLDIWAWGWATLLWQWHTLLFQWTALCAPPSFTSHSGAIRLMHSAQRTKTNEVYSMFICIITMQLQWSGSEWRYSSVENLMNLVLKTYCKSLDFKHVIDISGAALHRFCVYFLQKFGKLSKNIYKYSYGVWYPSNESLLFLSIIFFK